VAQFAIGDNQRAIDGFTYLNARRPNDPNILTPLAQLYHQLAQTKKAIELLAEYIQHIEKMPPSDAPGMIHISCDVIISLSMFVVHMAHRIGFKFGESVM
jgi:tetratricopeptide (TPR) repeat protein